jgi:hypothetical protein
MRPSSFVETPASLDYAHLNDAEVYIGLDRETV